MDGSFAAVYKRYRNDLGGILDMRVLPYLIAASITSGITPATCEHQPSLMGDPVPIRSQYLVQYTGCEGGEGNRTAGCIASSTTRMLD